MIKLLVIEDELPLLAEIQTMLEFEGFDVVCASNGEEGVKEALKETPDLIICDVMMPVLDGYGVIEELRRHPATAITPFIFLTAKSSRDDTRLGMDLGADDYLTKPFSSTDLVNAIKTRLARQDNRRQVFMKDINNLREHLTTALPHELRTPLTTIMGYAEFLVNDYSNVLTGEALDMVLKIHKAGGRLHRLIDKYLFFAQLEIIQADIARVKMMRNQVCDEASYIVSELAKSKAREWERSDDLVLKMTMINANIMPMYLSKLAEELIDNAFKFSTKGTDVVVTVGEDEQGFLLKVVDHGRGIDNEQLEQIGAYVQFERKLHEQQGSGLGLIVAKRITEIHGGHFSMESTVGKGTTVTVQLPNTPIGQPNSFERARTS
ncbi:MAG: response regulator [Anaerolineae bacterium]|nr:response regulator [Anaerolineae bacterium]